MQALLLSQFNSYRNRNFRDLDNLPKEEQLVNVKAMNFNSYLPPESILQTVSLTSPRCIQFCVRVCRNKMTHSKTERLPKAKSKIKTRSIELKDRPVL